MFWPPFSLLLIAGIFSIYNKESFLKIVNGLNTWILTYFDKAFSYTSLLMVILCLAVIILPIGRIRIGGENATPILTRWRWFSIVLCTTIAVGILFWGAAEPLYHLSSPPDTLDILDGKNQADHFAMSAMFMHWSFTPYAIYTIPALLFALGYYNRKLDFSLGSMLFPIMRNPNSGWWGILLNIICLFALVAGMSASLGAGMLILSGGISNITGTEVTPLLIGIIALVIVFTFSVSAASGLLRGIRVLSVINVTIFFIICLFILLFGPTAGIIKYMFIGLKEYIIDFIPHSLLTGVFSDKEWAHAWTTFNWANWMAWTPITALFLGRIGYGYRVREFILFNWFIPACFGILWMSIFSGTALHFETVQKLGLVDSLVSKGPESIIYLILDQLPLSSIAIIFFLMAVFISYVTAADSNTEAIAGISSRGITPDSSEPPTFVKYVWGVVIGLAAWIMVSYAGIDGIKMLSNLGGLPALFLLIFASIGLVVLFFKWRQLVE